MPCEGARLRNEQGRSGEGGRVGLAPHFAIHLLLYGVGTGEERDGLFARNVCYLEALYGLEVARLLRTGQESCQVLPCDERRRLAALVKVLRLVSALLGALDLEDVKI